MEMLLFPNFFIFAGCWVVLSSIAVVCMVGVRITFRKLFVRKSVVGSYLGG
jgi:hypothetical protein